jgi:PleD family two-component response regulator
MPKTDADEARRAIDHFLSELHRSSFKSSDSESRLTASCGVEIVVDSNDTAENVRRRADEIQYRAKKESKRHEPRKSAMAIQEDPVVTK